MSRDWEATFEGWGRPPSQAEQDEIDRAEREIRVALSGFTKLGDRVYKVYPKGSHRRGTNVRRGSDIDMAVELCGVPDSRSFLYDKEFKARDLTDSQLGVYSIPSTEVAKLGVDAFKKDVYDALVAAFGSRAVAWHNKCIQVRDGVTSLPADVVPCRSYRRYDSQSVVHDGIKIVPDKGSPIINWPTQDDDNGTAKNKRTNLRYKRAVRGLKALENEMTDKRVISEVPSFLIECGVFNVDDADFKSSSNHRNCVTVLDRMLRACNDGSAEERWAEVNDLKYLFRGTQTWTIKDLRRLVDGAVNYLGAG